MPTNQLAIFYKQNTPKISMFSTIILKWVHLLLLISLKLLKNVRMETGYFTKMFYLKKDVSCIQRMDQKRKETKIEGKLFVGLTYFRLCGCSVLIVISLLVNYRLCECSVLIEKLLLVNHRLYRCSIVTVMLMLVSYRLCRCSY